MIIYTCIIIIKYYELLNNCSIVIAISLKSEYCHHKYIFQIYESIKILQNCANENYPKSELQKEILCWDPNRSDFSCLGSIVFSPNVKGEELGEIVQRFGDWSRMSW